MGINAKGLAAIFLAASINSTKKEAVIIGELYKLG